MRETLEFTSFWNVLGGMDLYANDPRLFEDLEENPPRMFAISNAKGFYVGQPIYIFNLYIHNMRNRWS